MSNTRDFERVRKMVQRAKRAGKRVVTTNGVFDLVHVGHLTSLAYARSLGDVLIVGINSDASVKAIKGPQRPVIPAKDRLRMIKALSDVDDAFIFSATTAKAWLRILAPHVHVKGSDRALADVLEHETVERSGGRIVLAPHTKKHSTTAIIAKIQHG